jgi:hypothetical protein
MPWPTVWALWQQVAKGMAHPDKVVIGGGQPQMRVPTGV